MCDAEAYIWLQVEVSVAGNGKQCSEGAVQLEGVQLVSLLHLCVCVCVCVCCVCVCVCMNACVCVCVCVHVWCTGTYKGS